MATKRISLSPIFLAGVIVLLAGGCSRKAKTAAVTLPSAPVAAEPETAAKPPLVEAEKPAPPPVIPIVEKEDPVPDPESLPERSEDAEKDASALLEEALTAFQEAQIAIEAGEVDEALVRLDEAYGSILKVNCAPDSPLLLEKNELRILIAQRIQQIYATRMTIASSANGSIPLVENKWVLREIESFQSRERKAFEDAYKRSGLYREMILEELRKEGLPEELSWIPMIESAFKARALSRARALGLWQFIRSTGYRYGLKQDKYVDERMDPVRSTRAAIKYMIELHNLFGDWTTAIAGYNCGEMLVQRAIRAQRINYFDNFWDLFNNLPYETARHVPRIIAALLIIENPEKYGFVLPDPDPPLRFETIRINAPVKLAVVAQSLDIDPGLLTALNSELRHDSTPNYEYDLRVPQGTGERALEAIASLPQYIPPDVITERYTVRRGDTLGAIAARFRTTVSAIDRLNNLRGRTLIRTGQVLRIPSRGGASAAPPPPNAKPGETITYTVRTGDTLYQLSRTYRTTVQAIKDANGLASDILTVGQKLVIEVGRDPAGARGAPAGTS